MMQHKTLVALLLLAGLLVGALGVSAQETGACNIEAPAEAVEINLIAWSFPILDFYVGEIEACDDVENVSVNASLLASADVQEQVNLALSTGGDSPFDILGGANGQVSDWGGKGWLLPLNDLVEKYWDEYDLGDIPRGDLGRRHAGWQYLRRADHRQHPAPLLPQRCAGRAGPGAAGYL